MPTKPKPILISGETDEEIMLKQAAIQTVAEAATLESLQLLQQAVERGVDVNAKLKRAKNLGAI